MRQDRATSARGLGSIASRWRASASGPSLRSAREPASIPSAQSVPLARVRWLRRSSAATARSGRSDVGGGLDRFDESPAVGDEALALAGPLRGLQRLAVVAVGVMQHRGHPQEQAGRRTLAARHGTWHRHVGDRLQPHRITARRGQHQRRVLERRDADRLRDRIDLVDKVAASAKAPEWT